MKSEMGEERKCNFNLISSEALLSSALVQNSAQLSCKPDSRKPPVDFSSIPAISLRNRNNRHEPGKKAAPTQSLSGTRAWESELSCQEPENRWRQDFSFNLTSWLMWRRGRNLDCGMHPPLFHYQLFIINLKILNCIHSSCVIITLLSS